MHILYNILPHIQSTTQHIYVKLTDINKPVPKTHPQHNNTHTHNIICGISVFTSFFFSVVGVCASASVGHSVCLFATLQHGIARTGDVVGCGNIHQSQHIPNIICRMRPKIAPTTTRCERTTNSTAKKKCEREKPKPLCWRKCTAPACSPLG